MHNSLSTYKTISTTPYNSIQQANIAQAQAISGLLVILLPAVMVCAIVGHRKRKGIVLQQQIQRLNQIWQLDSSKKLS